MFCYDNLPIASYATANRNLYKTLQLLRIQRKHKEYIKQNLYRYRRSSVSFATHKNPVNVVHVHMNLVNESAKHKQKTIIFSPKEGKLLSKK